jgi:predicted nucleic acid-binding protein
MSESPEALIDSPLFVYPEVSPGGKGKLALKLLRGIRNGKLKPAISIATLYEIAAQATKLLGSRPTAELLRRVYATPNARFLPVNESMVAKYVGFILEGVHPRVSFHAAAALAAGVRAVVTEQAGFERVKELEVLDFEAAIRKWRL